MPATAGSSPHLFEWTSLPGQRLKSPASQLVTTFLQNGRAVAYAEIELREFELFNCL
jgi:hypothetical protein